MLLMLLLMLGRGNAWAWLCKCKSSVVNALSCSFAFLLPAFGCIFTKEPCFYARSRAADKRAQVQAISAPVRRVFGSEQKKKTCIFVLWKGKKMLKSPWKSHISNSQSELFGVKWHRKFQKHVIHHQKAILHTMLEPLHAILHRPLLTYVQ